MSKSLMISGLSTRQDFGVYRARSACAREGYGSDRSRLGRTIVGPGGARVIGSLRGEWGVGHAPQILSWN